MDMLMSKFTPHRHPSLSESGVGDMKCVLFINGGLMTMMMTAILTPCSSSFLTPHQTHKVIMGMS